MTSSEREKKTVYLMIGMYCKKQRHHAEMCEECRQLTLYAYEKIDQCRYNPKKPKCSKCTTHCYQKDKREKIRQVMRYSGPRMILYHPLVALRHMLR
ncbi:MAG TPA: nitrous oxide-stimulated promoter family protein [Bacteroidales bacterium]|nr:nitrous oxide-stimulated promoter family protein [Bacteroidales bacterium]HNZ42664.1 nitrous oxide-stimulated promoter family protein [Bacteroidales bacterium]HOH83862.1 nitrous oxide-stimulated promoter family protein [Bacteroidales bacterium]HPB25370.1 nitrous oxide-stimulated promoter family protein [Bacteroidales bacterium]HPI30131.1 nitrous oxide-stimulated promoter family protein [Bacteroidales bacterium]